MWQHRCRINPPPPAVAKSQQSGLHSLTPNGKLSSNYQLPTTNYQLPTTNYQLPTVLPCPTLPYFTHCYVLSKQRQSSRIHELRATAAEKKKLDEHNSDDSGSSSSDDNGAYGTSETCEYADEVEVGADSEDLVQTKETRRRVGPEIHGRRILNFGA